RQAPQRSLGGAVPVGLGSSRFLFRTAGAGERPVTVVRERPGTQPVALPDAAASPPARKHFGPADRAELAQGAATPGLARLLVVLAPPHFFRAAAPFQQFLEPPQGHPNGLAVVNAHAQCHSASFGENSDTAK